MKNRYRKNIGIRMASIVAGMMLVSSHIVYAQNEAQPQNQATPQAAPVATQAQGTPGTASPTTTNAPSVAPAAAVPVTPAMKITPDSPMTGANDSAKMKQNSQDLVKKAVDYIKANGKESAIKEFNKPDGAFVNAGLYVFVIDYQGVLLANSNTPDLVGKNLSNVQDPDGTYFAKDLIAKSQSGGGWVTYRYPNPATKKTDCKNSYVVAGGSDYLVGVGYYFPENPTTHKCEAP